MCYSPVHLQVLLLINIIHTICCHILIIVSKDLINTKIIQFWESVQINE